MTDTEAPGRITGLGGIFFKSRDTTALATWYRETLGIGMEGWDGAMFPTDAPGRPPFQLWGPFKGTSQYFSA